MNYPTKQKDEEDLNDFILEGKFSSSPMVGQAQQSLILNDLQNEKTSDIGKKIGSNLLIFSGGFLLYSSTLIFFHSFIAGLTTIAYPSRLFLFFTIGLVLFFFENGRIKKNSDWLLYSIIPLATLVLGILFTLAPKDWSGSLFGGYSLVFFLPILFLFYYVRDHFDKCDD